MKSSICVKLVALALCMASALFMCSCLPFQPPRPSKNTVERAVREKSGLDARLLSQIDDETYIFKDDSRGIEFKVVVRPEKVKIDASEGGFTGKYEYHIHYDLAVYESYSKDVEQLLKKYNFTDIERGTEHQDVITNIEIIVDKDLSDDKIETVNAFLRDLRDIAIKDIRAGHDFYSEMKDDFGYKVNITKVDRTGGGNLMYRVRGNGGIYSWRLTADVNDADLDLRKMDDVHQVYTSPQADGYYDVLISISG